MDKEERKSLERKIARTLNTWFDQNPEYDGFGVRSTDINIDGSGTRGDAFVRMSPKKLHGLNLEKLTNLSELDIWGFKVADIEFVYEDRVLYIQVLLSKPKD